MAEVVVVDPTTNACSITFTFPLGGATNVTFRFVESNAVTPVVAKVFPLEEARQALMYLTEDRPFGRVILKL